MKIIKKIFRICKHTSVASSQCLTLSRAAESHSTQLSNSSTRHSARLTQELQRPQNRTDGTRAIHSKMREETMVVVRSSTLSQTLSRIRMSSTLERMSTGIRCTTEASNVSSRLQQLTMGAASCHHCPGNLLYLRGSQQTRL